MKSLFLATNGIRLHAMGDGPADGKLVVLLHGFPDFWYGWKAQIPALAAAGYRVLAIDQRGFNLSDKPTGAANYRVSLLARDIEEILEREGRGQAALVGHDWGGAVTWAIASRRPDLVRKFVVVNCPHPRALPRRLLTDPEQLRRSWYVFLFQLPWLPEAVIRSGYFRLPIRGFRTASPGTFVDDDFEKYREAWSQPGALTAMVNWYRGAFRPGPKAERIAAAAPPGMLVWGTADPFLKEVLADDSARLYPGLRVEPLPGVGHWVPQESAEALNTLLLQFLR